MMTVAPVAMPALSHVTQRTTCGLLGARTIRPSGPLSSRISRAMTNRDPRRVCGGDAVRRDRAWLLPMPPAGLHRAWLASVRRRRRWPWHRGPVPRVGWEGRGLWRRCRAQDEEMMREDDLAGQ